MPKIAKGWVGITKRQGTAGREFYRSRKYF